MLSQERIEELRTQGFEVNRQGVLLKYRGPGGYVVIPAGVTTIGVLAFHGCAALEHVVIPAGVRTIGEDAFSGCAALRELVIPAGVTTIGRNAFYRCASLEHAVISEGVATIGEGAFSGCAALVCVEIPEGVTTIGRSAFYGCAALEHVVIPAGVTTIGKGAFEKCVALEYVVIPAGVTTIGSSAFRGCAALRELVIPASVTAIGEAAFSECYQLGFVVTSLQEGAFANAGLCQDAVVLTPQQAAHVQRITLRLPQHNPAAIDRAPLYSFFSPASAPAQHQDAFRRMLSPQDKHNIRGFFGVVETVLLVALRVSRLNADGPEAGERAAPRLPDELWRCVLDMLFYVETTFNDGGAPAQSSIAKLRALC